MKFKVVGTIIENGKRRKICYEEFDKYSNAFDYKKWLEDSNNWKDDSKKQPYMVCIVEIKTEGDKYYNNMMENEEQDDY